MTDQNQSITILIAEDDLDDRAWIEQAFIESGFEDTLFFVQDGIELMQYVRKQGRFASPGTAPLPDLILLELNMPNMDGRQALAELKAEPEIRRIPVVVLTVSTDEQDIRHTYDHGGAGFIIKPETFDGMLEVVRVLNQYWFETVELAGGQLVKKIRHHRLTRPISE
jgi:two-component system response regulator